MVFSVSVVEKLDIYKEQYEAATQTLMDNRQTTKSINYKASSSSQPRACWPQETFITTWEEMLLKSRGQECC